MKDYKKDYDILYKLDGVNYSGIVRNIDLTRDLNGKYLDAFVFLKEIKNYKNLEILEVGASVGRASMHFPNYIGIEYSQKAVDIGKQIYGEQINLIQSDARELPFDDKSKDFVFSINVLEHIPEPHKALDELVRVTRFGGYVWLDPAYNCRHYTVQKLEFRRYSELSLFDKFEKFFIPVLNNFMFRAISAIPRRIFLEILFFINKRPLRLFYRKLEPDFKLIQKYGHTSDDDAFSSFDKHSIILYYLSRKYKVMGYETILKRIFCRTGPVIIKL